MQDKVEGALLERRMGSWGMFRGTFENRTFGNAFPPIYASLFQYEHNLPAWRENFLITLHKMSVRAENFTP